MEIEDALAIVVARTRHERYRVLCDPAHPDSVRWRAIVLGMAQGQEEPGAMALAPWPIFLAATPIRATPASEAPEAERGCGCGRA